MKTLITLEVTHTKPLPAHAADFAAQRLYTALDGHAQVEVVPQAPAARDLMALAFPGLARAADLFPAPVWVGVDMAAHPDVTGYWPREFAPA